MANNSNEFWGLGALNGVESRGLDSEIGLGSSGDKSDRKCRINHNRSICNKFTLSIIFNSKLDCYEIETLN